MIVLSLFSISASFASEVNNDINIETLSDNVETTNLNGIESGVGHSTYDQSVNYADANSDNGTLDSNNTNSDNGTSDDNNSSDDKNNASFIVPDTEIAQGQYESFNVTLIDENTGSPLYNQTVSFTVNTITYNRTTDVNGIAGLLIRLNSRNYNMSYFFLGNNDYNPVSGSCILKVIPVKDTTVSPIGSDVIRGQTLDINLSSEDGPVVNQSVYITVNGITYNRITDNDGIARLVINLLPRYYTVNYTFNGSRFFKPSSGQLELHSIDGNYISNMTAVNSTVIQGSPFKVILANAYGVIIPNAEVVISVNGRNYTTTTDENGIAQLTINLRVGYYTISYKFNGTDLISASNGSSNLTVIPKENTNLIALNSNVNQGNYYEAVLCDSNNNAIINQTVTITVNTVSYNRTTDDEGVARLLIRLLFGYYKIDSVFEGNAQYNGAVLNDNMLVLNSSKTNTLISVDNFVKNLTENKSLEILLTDINGTPIVGENVSFTINGVTYNLTTNASGIATIPIRLNKGSYDATVFYYGNNKYNQNIAFTNVLVNGTFLIGHDLSLGYLDGSKFNVSLLNATRDPIVNQIVYMTIDGVTYPMLTNEMGIASLPINLPNGTYLINYSYLGSEEYPSSEGSNLVIVENRLGIDRIIHYIVNEVYPYILLHHVLPGAITMDSVIYPLEEYMYILTNAIVNINAGSLDYVVLHNVLSGSYEQSLGEGNLPIDQYLNLANIIINDVKNGNSISDVYSTSIGDISFDRILYGFIKVLAQYASDNKLPGEVEIGSLAKTYDTTTISGMAGYLTDGLLSDYDKAVALFNWVRDEITYQYYSNSLKGASGAFRTGTANCCDQSNLLVQMARSVGLTIQYRHCTNCYFYIGGSYYGHVWVQFIIDGKVYQADPCSTRNSFGKIVNFNYNSVVGNTRTYNNLPF